MAKTKWGKTEGNNIDKDKNNKGKRGQKTEVKSSAVTIVNKLVGKEDTVKSKKRKLNETVVKMGEKKKKATNVNTDSQIEETFIEDD